MLALNLASPALTRTAALLHSYSFASTSFFSLTTFDDVFTRDVLRLLRKRGKHF